MSLDQHTLRHWSAVMLHMTDQPILTRTNVTSGEAQYQLRCLKEREREREREILIVYFTSREAQDELKSPETRQKNWETEFRQVNKQKERERILEISEGGDRESRVGGGEKERGGGGSKRKDWLPVACHGLPYQPDRVTSYAKRHPTLKGYHSHSLLLTASNSKDWAEPLRNPQRKLDSPAAFVSVPVPALPWRR